METFTTMFYGRHHAFVDPYIVSITQKNVCAVVISFCFFYLIHDIYWYLTVTLRNMVGIKYGTRSTYPTGGFSPVFEWIRVVFCVSSRWLLFIFVSLYIFSPDVCFSVLIQDILYLLVSPAFHIKTIIKYRINAFTCMRLENQEVGHIILLSIL